MPEIKRRTIQEQVNELLATTKNKSYFVGAVTVLFVVVMVLGGILPSYSAFTAQAEQNGKRQEVIDKLEKKRNYLEDLVREEDQKADLYNKFLFIFPEEPDQLSVIKELNTLAVGRQSILLNSAFSESLSNTELIRTFQVTKQVKSQTVSLLFEGDRGNLVNFIRDIEENVRIMNVKSVVISRKVGKELEDSSVDRQFKLNIQLEFYYYNR